MMRRKKTSSKRGTVGYVVLGTLVVLLILFCIIMLMGALAPMILRMHAGDQPAMMTMPILIYCIFADLILLEVVLLTFQPGVKDLVPDPEAQPTDKKKRANWQTVTCIVCCALVLCSIIIGPNVCTVFTEQGVDSYVFFKTESYTWDDIALYELEFTKERGLSLSMFISKDKFIPLFGSDKFCNQAFVEKYVDEYGFACHLKELAHNSDTPFKVIGREYIESFFKDSIYWEHIEKLIQ